MFFHLKKILGFWAMPLPLGFVAVVLGVMLLRQKRFRVLGRRAGWPCLICGCLLLLIFGNVGVANYLLFQLEERHAPIPELAQGMPPPDNLAPCQYVVVLGGGTLYHEGRSSLTRLSWHSLARLAEGLRLAHVLPSAQLVVSGYSAEDLLPTMASEYERAAISLGFASGRIVRFDTPKDTREEITELRARIGDAPVAVVTSAFHMERAMVLCRELRVNAVACPTAFSSRTQKNADFLKWSLGAYATSAVWFHEWLGRLFA
ncbi:MAG: YdcF family protein [Puniceicoccales bacterium]|jgi:uncharacterized SAM-binding protein YcdF (DUF218 family)|nr:YdcF family protein [Puniceicoccales bacterium]